MLLSALSETQHFFWLQLLGCIDSLHYPLKLDELFCSGYVAPEVWKFGANNRGSGFIISRKVDIYSLGVIIMDLLVGHDKNKFLWNEEGGRYKVDKV